MYHMHIPLVAAGCVFLLGALATTLIFLLYDYEDMTEG